MDCNYQLNLHLQASKTATSNQPTLTFKKGVACAALKAQHHALEKRGQRGDLVRKKHAQEGN